MNILPIKNIGPRLVRLRYPHFLRIGFGVDRLWDLTVTVFGPGFPTLSGLHFVFIRITPFLGRYPTKVIKVSLGPMLLPGVEPGWLQ